MIKIIIYKLKISMTTNNSYALNGTLNIDHYDIILIDLWGVVYDGNGLYPQVLNTLKKLRYIMKEVIFFSNTPRRKATIETSLKRFNIDNSLYKDIVVSGELVNELLTCKKLYGHKYFYLGSPESEEAILNIKGYRKVNQPQNADFCIITGVINYFDQAMKLAKQAIHYKLPLICINPDKLSITKDGEMMYCAGIIAEKYKKFGGKVIYFGKPYKEIYRYALRSIPAIKKVLAIGDSMDNDIRGALNNNIDCALICSGIHRHELNIKVGELPTNYRLAQLYNKHSFKPHFVLSILSEIVK